MTHRADQLAELARAMARDVIRTADDDDRALIRANEYDWLAEHPIDWQRVIDELGHPGPADARNFTNEHLEHLERLARLAYPYPGDELAQVARLSVAVLDVEDIAAILRTSAQRIESLLP